MRKLIKIILVTAIGSLNAFAIWRSSIELTGNFGKDKVEVEKNIKNFQEKLNGESGSLTVN